MLIRALLNILKDEIFKTLLSVNMKLIERHIMIISKESDIIVIKNMDSNKLLTGTYAIEK